MAADDPSNIALAACLGVVLAELNDDDSFRFVVHEARTISLTGFCIIWTGPYYPGKLGYYTEVPVLGGIAGVDHRGDPAGDGYDVASFVIIEPLGTTAHRLAPDDDGIAWIGRPPPTRLDPGDNGSPGSNSEP